MAYDDEQSAPPDDQGFRIAVTVIGLMLLAAVVFTLYLVLGDGGGNT